MTPIEKDLWIEDAKERMEDDERVIAAQSRRIAELELHMDRLRTVMHSALKATAGVAPVQAEDVIITFTQVAQVKGTKRTRKAVSA